MAKKVPIALRSAKKVLRAERLLISHGAGVVGAELAHLPLN